MLTKKTLMYLSIIFIGCIVLFLIVHHPRPINKKQASVQIDSSFVIKTPDGFPTDYLQPCIDVSNDSYRPGRGLKTGTYDVVQCAIDTSSLQMDRVTSSDAGKTTADYKVVEDFSSLKKFMGLNISMNANIGWFSMESSLKKSRIIFSK